MGTNLICFHLQTEAATELLMSSNPRKQILFGAVEEGDGSCRARLALLKRRRSSGGSRSQQIPTQSLIQIYLNGSYIWASGAPIGEDKNKKTTKKNMSVDVEHSPILIHFIATHPVGGELRSHLKPNGSFSKCILYTSKNVRAGKPV